VLELLRRAYDVLPQITELELVEISAGLRPATPDNCPLVGSREIEGLHWATGHWRNGVLQAPLAARAIVARLAGRAVAG
jgi:glycine oxidase